jgi:uncharacterized membrane protein
MRLKLRLKKKSKDQEEAKLKPDQKMALHALQKQLQLIELKEWLYALGFIGIASLLRVPMQAIPNVEPLTFFAILAGWLFGWKKGFLVGASSLYISNFLVVGGQGPWTIFQVLGYGLAGFLGGFLRNKSTIFEVFLVTLIATLSLQLIFNVGWSFLIGFNILAAVLTGLIFTAVHVVSNLFFAAFLPIIRKFVNETGKFNEKELCRDLIAKLTDRMPKRSTK